MSKNTSNNLITPEDWIARGGFTMSKMQPGVSALIESTVGVMYTLRLVDPFTNLIEFYSTDNIFRRDPAKRCYFIASYAGSRGSIAIPDWVVKDGRMLIKFSDADFLCHPVRSALLEGPNWKYEVINP